MPGVTVITRATGAVRFQPFDPSAVWTTVIDGPLAVMHHVDVAWALLPARSVATIVNVCGPVVRPV